VSDVLRDLVRAVLAEAIPVVAAESQRLLSVEKAAQYLDIGTETLRQIVDRGEIPHVRVGRLVKVDRRDLDSWIDRGKAA
jgi:excisionase family DNA binding protein